MKLQFLRLFVWIALIATSLRGYNGGNNPVTSNNWSTTWAAASGAGTVSYTLGSGTVPGSPGYEWFKTYPTDAGVLNLDGTYDLNWLAITTFGATGVTVSSTNGTNALVLTSNAAVGATQAGISIDYTYGGVGLNNQINAPIYLGNPTSVTGGIVAFVNNTLPSQNDTLTFGTTSTRYNIQGLQIGSSVNDPVTLTLYGEGNGVINDNIIDGTGQGVTNPGTAVISLDFVSTGTWTLTGVNTYSGPTLVTGGGTLLLDDTSDAGQKISTGALTIGGSYPVTGAIGGGTLELKGNASTSSTQTVSSTTIAQGADTIAVVSGSGQSATFNLNSLNRTAAGMINFVTTSVGGGTATINTTGLASTTVADANGTILGGWATLNGTDWANVDSNGNIVAATYVNFFGAGNDVQITASQIAGDTSSNSLQFTSATAPVTVTLASGANTIASGGILVSSAEGTQSVTITGGTIFSSYFSTTGAGTTSNEIYVQQFDLNAPLIIKSILGSPILTLAGGGVLNLSGTNMAVTTVNIDAGTLQAGSNTPFNATATVNLDGNTSALDLNGHNVTLSNLTSSNIISGVTALNQGLVPVVKNSAAGTISTLTLSTATFSGDFAEGAGAVLNLVKNGSGLANIESGAWLAGIYSTEGNGAQGNLPQGIYEVLNGSLTINGGNVSTDGDLYLLGNIAIASGSTIQAVNNNNGLYGLVSTSYITGLGAINEDTNRGAVYVNLGLAPTSTDTFGGTVTGGHLVIEGSGTFVLSAAQVSNTSFNFIDALGATTVQTLGVPNAATGLSAMGAATMKVIGTSGPIAGGIDLAGGTLWIAPSGTGTTAALTADTGANVAFNYGIADSVGNSTNVVAGNGNLLLDRGNYTNLNLTMGAAANTSADVVRKSSGTLVIQTTDGLSGLGSTEKLVLLGGSAALPTVTNNMVSASILGASAQSGSVGQATFLNYSGSGGAGDTGFIDVVYNDTNFALATSSSNTLIEQVNGTATSISGSNAVYALQDNGTLTNTGTLTIGNGSTVAGLILNNGTIAGSGTLTAGATELAIYTNGIGTINNTITNTIPTNGTSTLGLTIFGPGTLYLKQSGNLTYSGETTLNSGVLDIGSLSLSATSPLYLQGGILQTTGTFIRAFGGSGGAFAWDNGGFADSSATTALNIKIGNATTAYTWSSNFLSDGSILQLGSPTALGVVNFQNGIILGTLGTGNTYSGSNGTALYRDIGVTDNASTFGDYGQISGVISDSTGDFRGIEKVGNGLLYLSATNTYQGPTAITAGTLQINSDSSLGTAPTQAYAITNTVTFGAVQIDGLATLLANTGSPGGTVDLSANRTILLGGGGASGLAVENGQTLQVDSRIGDAINTIAAGGGSGGGSLDINPTTGNGYDATQTGGTVIFTSNFNTYSGGTTVETGTTFFANNTLSTSSATGTGSVTIKSGAVLRGTGYIAPAIGNSVTIASGANLAPGGIASGTAAVGALALTAGSTTSGPVLNFSTPALSTTLPQLTFSLGSGTNLGTGAGLVFNGVTLAGSSTYISLPVDSAGEVVFSASAALKTLIQLNDLTNGSLALGNYLLFAGTSNTDYTNIAQVNGALTGNLALANMPTGDSATLFLHNGDIYVDVESAAPEPSTYALLLMGFVGVLVFRLRKAMQS